MKKITAGEKAAYLFSLALAILFISMTVLAIVLFHTLSLTEKELADYRTDAEIGLSDLEKQKNELTRQAAELKNRIELAEKTRAELERRVGEAEAELKALEASFGNTDALYGKLNAQVTELKGSLAAKDEEIASLKKELEALNQTYGADLNEQYRIVTELATLLREGAPMNRVETPVMNTDGTPALNENGDPVTEVSYVYPKISIYYEDIARGYRYRFNDSIVYPAADCSVAPYALSILQAASEEQQEYDRKLAEYVAAHGPADVLPDFDRTYDLSKYFTYTEEKYRPGAGIIKDSEFGVQFTYEELFEKLLQYQDEVAYAELKATYGSTLYENLLRSLGTVSLKGDSNTATVTDLALIMKTIHTFTETSAPYAPLLQDAMMSSVHTVMIGNGVSPKEIAHMNGWDEGAYHDMAIVYDTHPYVLVIMTDMDEGGEEVNTYLQKVAALIDELHETFDAS